ncbi:beta-1,6-N-acetylglucosaminyltransferase [Ruminococcus sp.]|uniref:beta-1,6-N-acetylglucosaminyltransferase n=1 Tax=Ruminococcus sp. TaxID=41978 RepID=UPI003EFEF333
MKKHAYLIMAHNNWGLLKKIIILLDDERNDIFVHIDKNSSDFKIEYFEGITNKSELYFIPRLRIYWADYSLVDVELKLLSFAASHGSYQYYHLLSGSDLPIKTQDEIHYFFENKDNEFIGICPQEVYYSVRRVKYYHPFLRNRFYRKNKFVKGADRCFEYLQRLFCVNRLKNKNIKIIDGWQWFSITDDFARYIISQRDYIEETFSKSIASDELVMQTMIYNNPDFYNRIYNDEDLVKGSLRYIDWKRGEPYTFRKEDFEEIINQDEAIFARKFDPNVDSEIIDKIFHYIYTKQKNC